MKSRPIIIKDYSPSSFKLRENTENKKFLGDANFYFKGYKYEKDRIKVFLFCIIKKDNIERNL